MKRLFCNQVCVIIFKMSLWLESKTLNSCLLMFHIKDASVLLFLLIHWILFDNNYSLHAYFVITTFKIISLKYVFILLNTLFFRQNPFYPLYPTDIKSTRWIHILFLTFSMFFQVCFSTHDHCPYPCFAILYYWS